jgi:hypothetical protein
MLVFCDRIANDIRKALRGGWLSGVGPVRFDLHPEEHYMLSTKKFIEVCDGNGTRYRITVEEVK